MNLIAKKRIWLMGALALTPAWVVGLGGCCTSATCLDSKSSADQNRVKAKPISVDAVDDDFISIPRRDRTDWKSVDLKDPGKLTVELHWDQAGVNLELSIYDALGAKIQDARPWRGGGVRTVVAIEQPGRYYMRVRALGGDDETHYALRLRYKADAPAIQCHECKPDERRCLGKAEYIVCVQVGPKCTAFNRVEACPAGVGCRKGACGGCNNECARRDRRCMGPTAFQICERAANSCRAWSAQRECPSNMRCRRGRCAKGKKGSTPVAVTPKPREKTAVKAKIISIYNYRGRMTLHIEVGDNPAVKPGQMGTVLAGKSDKPLAGGEIKISKVAGRYAIATTKLEKLGKNRWVKINVK